MASIRFTPEDNLSGDPAQPQGFGRVGATLPPHFAPGEAQNEAVAYFAANGFVVLSGCLEPDEIRHLNEFFDRTQREVPERWGLGARRKRYHRNQGLIFSQPLLDYPELDRYVQHEPAYAVVAALLGGGEHVRYSEFNFRETPENAGVGQMDFHHDAVSPDRFDRAPYMPVDWLCAIHYLTDTDATTPAFCVVPRSHRYETLREAYDALGDDYSEVPIYGAAGTCVLYDTALYHTRFDGDGKRGRRTWHQYYARGGWLRSSLPESERYVRPPSPNLTNWNLIPERLALHPDPATRLFFSHWNSAQGEWAASGFDPEVRAAMPRGED